MARGIRPRQRSAPGHGARWGGLETPDQKIALAQVLATLSVAQELSGMIEDKGLTVRVDAPLNPERDRRVTVFKA